MGQKLLLSVNSFETFANLVFIHVVWSKFPLNHDLENNLPRTIC